MGIEYITRIDDPESIKKILDAFDEHRKEVEKKAPHCDCVPDENCPGLWKPNPVRKPKLF